jgi:hypothetical protein
MPKSGNPYLRQTILEVVENQLRDGDPPETAATLERLIKEGQSREAAVELIAAVLAAEIFNVMKTKKPYDNARYVGRLKQLPDMPWDK